GDDLTLALGRTGLFPDDLLRIVAVAEESGTLSEVMRHQGDHYHEEATRRLAVLTSVAGYGIWGLIALFIIVMIFRLYGSYLTMLTPFCPFACSPLPPRPPLPPGGEGEPEAPSSPGISTTARSLSPSAVSPISRASGRISQRGTPGMSASPSRTSRAMRTS